MCHTVSRPQHCSTYAACTQPAFLGVIFTLQWSVTPPPPDPPPHTRSSTPPPLNNLTLLHSPLFHYQPMCCLHCFFPFPSNRATGAGVLEISCAAALFSPLTLSLIIAPSHTSAYNNKDWLLRGGCRPIAFHCADAKLEVNGHSQTLLPRPQTVSSFRYLSISALYVELLPSPPRRPGDC